MFDTLLVNDGPGSEVAHDALALAGCRNVEAVTSAAALARRIKNPVPHLVVVFTRREDLRTLRELTLGFRDVPVIAVCDERTLEPALLAGATDCVATPVRALELAARVRGALRARSEAKRRATRERRMSDAIEALQREKHDLERLACVDPLTGIANRRHTLMLLEAEWRRSAREHASLGVVMLDLDCYHAYNEQYGHLGGDTCLQRVADAMVRCLRRPADFLGRYGGEEFIAVLPNTDAAGAKLVAERLRAAVEDLAIPHAASTCSRVVTITAGFASLRVVAELAVDRLIGAADEALLRAKAAGRNRVEGDAGPALSTHPAAEPMPRYAPVHADPWYAARIPRFFSDVEDRARAVIDALREGNRALLPIANEIMATAQSLSLEIVEKLAQELVCAIERDEDAAILDVAKELIHYATHVQVIYRRRPSAHPDAAALIPTG